MQKKVYWSSIIINTLVSFILISCGSDEFDPEKEISSSVETIGADLKYIALSRPMLPPLDNTQADSPKIRITEVCWYASPGCYNAQPAFNIFKHETVDIPKTIDFLPMPNNALAELHAKMYFANQQYGLGIDTHRSIFDEMHTKNNRLETDKDIANYIARTQNLNFYTYLDTLQSKRVEEKVAETKAILQKANIVTIPTYILNGRYVVTVKLSGSEEAAFLTLKKLIEEKL